MTNREYFWDRPLSEAMDKIGEDTNAGLREPFEEWLDCPYMDLTKGKVVRGTYFSNEAIEEKIRKMEAIEVTGYLLEWQSKDGSWKGSEFDPCYKDGKGSTNGNLWLNEYLAEACDEWFSKDVQVGFFKELPEVWFSGSDDWEDRIGVDFDSRVTPRLDPSPVDIWGGVSKECDGDLWRVRKVTIKGTLSDNAKEFFRNNPDVEFEYAAKSDEGK